MSVADLLATLQMEAKGRAYIRWLEMLEYTPSLLKARLYVTRELFVQVYRNDRFDTTTRPDSERAEALWPRPTGWSLASAYSYVA